MFEFGGLGPALIFYAVIAIIAALIIGIGIGLMLG